MGLLVTRGQTETFANQISPGCRIGRVTEGLLLPIAEAVDVVEPVAKLTAALQGKPGVRSISNVGLAEWRPSEGEGVSYDLIWIQWCLGYVTDTQLVDHLRLCKSVLANDGLIVIKENLSTSGQDHFHEEDGSITRQAACPRRSSCAIG